MYEKNSLSYFPSICFHHHLIIFICLCSVSLRGERVKHEERQVFGIIIHISKNNLSSLKGNEEFIRLAEHHKLMEKRYFPIAEVLVFDSPPELTKDKLRYICEEIAKTKIIISCELNLRLQPQSLIKTSEDCPEQPAFPALEELTTTLSPIGQCLLPPVKEGEPWDAFWAQHQTGTDLLREILEKENISNDDIFSAIEVWDSSVFKHGEYSSQLIARDKDSAVIPMEGTLPFHEMTSSLSYIQRFERLAEDCLRNNNCPLYINNSMGWGNSPIISRLFSIMSSRGATVIVSAGNNAQPIEEFVMKKASESNRAIIVSSLDPDGFPSNFTNYGDYVTISTGSGTNITSYDFDGNKKDFGGTSGAAPVITGTLGGFTSLSNYPLATHEITHLLTKTAIPMTMLPDGHHLGAGMLNAYKIGRVGQRIKEQCDHHPSNGGQYECMSDALRVESTYRFQEESGRLFDNAKKSFPECLTESDADHSLNIDSCKKVEDFNNLRRAALLNPENTMIWKVLTCIREKHFPENPQVTEFYQRMAEAPKSREQKLQSICQSSDEKYSRLASYLSLPDLSELIEDETCSDLTFSFIPKAQDFPLALNTPSMRDRFFSSPKINANILGNMIPSILNNTEQNRDYRQWLERIISHDQVSPETLSKMALSIANNADNLPDYDQWFERIFNHEKANSYTLGGLAFAILAHNNKIPNYLQWIERIISDERTDGYTLGRIFEGISTAINKLPNDDQWFERILNDERTDTNTLWGMANVILFDVAGHIADQKQQWLGRVVNHDKIESSTLVSIVLYIGYLTNDLPDYKQLVEVIINSDKVDGTILKEMADAIEANSSDMPNPPEELLEQLRNHPKWENANQGPP